MLLIRRPDRSGHRRRPGLRGVRRPGRALAGVRGVHRRPRGARPRPGRRWVAAVRWAWRRPTGRCSASAPTASTTRAAPSAAGRSPRRWKRRTPRRPGRSRTSAATGSRPTWWCSRTASTTDGSTRSPRSPSPAPTWRAGSTSTTCAAAPGCACPLRPRRSGCAGSSRRPGTTPSGYLGATSDGDVTTARFDVRARRTPSASAPARRRSERLTCQAKRDNPVPIHELSVDRVLLADILLVVARRDRATVTDDVSQLTAQTVRYATAPRRRHGAAGRRGRGCRRVRAGRPWRRAWHCCGSGTGSTPTCTRSTATSSRSGCSPAAGRW